MHYLYESVTETGHTFGDPFTSYFIQQYFSVIIVCLIANSSASKTNIKNTVR